MKGVVVHDWQFIDLIPLVQAVHNGGVGVTQLDVFVSLTMERRSGEYTKCFAQAKFRST